MKKIIFGLQDSISSGVTANHSTLVITKVGRERKIQLYNLYNDCTEGLPLEIKITPITPQGEVIVSQYLENSVSNNNVSLLCELERLQARVSIPHFKDQTQIAHHVSEQINLALSAPRQLTPGPFEQALSVANSAHQTAQLAPTSVQGVEEIVITHTPPTASPEVFSYVRTFINYYRARRNLSEFSDRLVESVKSLPRKVELLEKNLEAAHASNNLTILYQDRFLNNPLIKFSRIVFDYANNHIWVWVVGVAGVIGGVVYGYRYWGRSGSSGGSSSSSGNNTTNIFNIGSSPPPNTTPGSVIPPIPAGGGIPSSSTGSNPFFEGGTYVRLYWPNIESLVSSFRLWRRSMIDFIFFSDQSPFRSKKFK